MDANKKLNHEGHEEHDGSLDGAALVPQSSVDLLRLCAAVYAGLSDSEISQVELIVMNRSHS